VSLATLEKIFENRKFDIDRLEFKIHKKNISLNEFYHEIDKWENLSINLTKLQLKDKDIMIINERHKPKIFPSK